VLKQLAVGSFVGLAFFLAACGSSSDNATPTPTHLGNGDGSTTSAATATGAATTPATTENGGVPTVPAVLDPCQLVTQQEAAQATGEPVGPGMEQNDGKQCEWDYTDPSDEFSGLNISFSVDSDPEAFREDQQGGLGTVTVSGVGDEAYFDPAGIASILTFRKGDLLFDVGMNVAGNVADQFSADAQEAAEKQLALYALARIP